LLDAGETSSLAERDFPIVGTHLTRQNSKERGFAGSVRADETDAISIRNGEGDVLKERVRSEGLCDLLSVDNGRQ
jgi:hypothetical protein